jgi:AraC-type DNA-binding domain-containing proteins
MSSDLYRITESFFDDNIPFMINKYSYDNYEELTFHNHNFVEIAFVFSGKGIHVFGNHRQPVSKGDLCIINIDTPHCFYPNDKQNSDNLKVYNCMFMPEFIKNMDIKTELLQSIINIFLYKSIYSEEIKHTPDLSLSGSYIKEIETVFEEMYSEYNKKEEGYADILSLLLYRLLILIYRAYKKQNETSNNADLYRQLLIHKTIEYLNENYSSKLSLDEICQHAYLSKSYYSSLFKKITGISVFDYIQKIRIEKACQLLSETSNKITAIAFSVGYSNYRFFNKTFKKVMGITALEYRKKAVGKG